MVNSILARIATLEALFVSSAVDMVEKGYRNELIWYGVVPCLDPVLISYQ